MTLAIVRSEPVACFLWAHRHVPDGEPHPIGANCRACGRDVALRRVHCGREAICVYCALDRGLLEPIEIEPCDMRFPDERQVPLQSTTLERSQ
jgi:hypothetical protein